MDDIVAKSPTELLTALRGIDISVPLRTRGRTTENCERWSICRLLSTLAVKKELAYPVYVHHQDKPDFRLQSGAKIIGIEVTEAIPQDYAKASAMSERQDTEGVIDLSLFRWAAEPKTTKELKEIISQRELSEDGWDVDTPEAEWVEAILNIIDSKHKKLLSPDFERFAVNWLLVYDNLPLPNPDPVLSLKYLSTNLQPFWSLSIKFDLIFIESGDEILSARPTGSIRWSVNNLWKSA